MINTENIVIQLEGWRKHRGYTQDEMALKLHMSTTTYRRKRLCPGNFTIDELNHAEKVTGITLVRGIGR